MTQQLTIEQLKFAREIGATHIDTQVEPWVDQFYRKDGSAYVNGSWDEGWSRLSVLDAKTFAYEKIDFTPLDEYYDDKEVDIAATGGEVLPEAANDPEFNGVPQSAGEPLTWPISEELIGRKVRFDGYVTGGHSHWDYVVGEEYLIVNKFGNIGPVNIRGGAPLRNFDNDFKFTLLPEQEIPDGYYHDDESGKLKPLKPVPAHDMVNHPPHYQTDGIECIDAIRASLGLEGFVAYCRGNAIKYSWRAGKKDETAQDLKKAAWYLNRAADEMIKNNERTAGVNQ